MALANLTKSAFSPYLVSCQLKLNLGACCSRLYGTGSNLPQQPKKPATPYIKLFSEISRNNTKSVFFAAKQQKDVAKQAAEKYKLMDSREKLRLTAVYQEELVAYKSQKEAFMLSLSEEQRKQLQEQQQAKRMKRAQAKKTRAKRELDQSFGKPKRKESTGFFVFQKSRFEAAGKKSKTMKEFQQLVKENAQMWKDMPEDKKEVYRGMAADIRAQYERELCAWEESMLAQGHPEVVRQASIPKELLKEIKAAAKKKSKS